MAVFNGEKFIADQIRSILGQLGKQDEIIISDDGSKDNTLGIIDSFRDPRIFVIKNTHMKGPAYNFENALKNATGDLIFLSDQDDIWHQEKIPRMLPWLRNYDLVVSDCIVVDKDLNVLKDSFFGEKPREPGLFKNLHHNPYMGCCMAFKKSVLNYVLPFPCGLDLHDIWIGLSVELNGRTGFIDDKLILFRRHGTNSSPSGEKSCRPLYSKVYYRLVVLLALYWRTLNYKLKIFIHRRNLENIV